MLFRKSPEQRNQKEFEKRCRQATLETINRGRPRNYVWPLESITIAEGSHVPRLRSSFFYWASLGSIVAGVVLLNRGSLVGASLILTLAPFLLLYPPIRFLFGGKDSVGAVVTTAIIEEIFKYKLFQALDKSRNRNQYR